MTRVKIVNIERIGAAIGLSGIEYISSYNAAFLAEWFEVA